MAKQALASIRKEGGVACRRRDSACVATPAITAYHAFLGVAVSFGLTRHTEQWSIRGTDRLMLVRLKEAAIQ